MSHRCDCSECNAAFRDLEHKVEALENQLRSLRYDLERETEDRLSAIRTVRSDLADMYAEVTTR